jgi:hypothetical protein
MEEILARHHSCSTTNGIVACLLPTYRRNDSENALQSLPISLCEKGPGDEEKMKSTNIFRDTHD